MFLRKLSYFTFDCVALTSQSMLHIRDMELFSIAPPPPMFFFWEGAPCLECVTDFPKKALMLSML